MSAPHPVAYVVDSEPREAAARLLPGRVAVAVVDVPEDPYDLTPRAFVVADVIDGQDTARAALLAAVRGVPLVVRVALPVWEHLAYLEELGRVADVRPAPVDGASLLTPEQRALLQQLAAGHTVETAAARLGWSRRTATRRLTAAKDALGVATTAEALNAVGAS